MLYVVDSVMLPAEDKMMTLSTDVPAAEADTEHIPLWIGKSLSQTSRYDSFMTFMFSGALTALRPRLRVLYVHETTTTLLVCLYTVSRQKVSTIFHTLA